MTLELKKDGSDIEFVAYGETHRLPSPDRLKFLAHAKAKHYIKMQPHVEASEFDYEIVDSTDGESQMLAVIAYTSGKTLKILKADELPDFWGNLMAVCPHITDYRVRDMRELER